jgi:hypothetical protein
VVLSAERGILIDPPETNLMQRSSPRSIDR